MIPGVAARGILVRCGYRIQGRPDVVTQDQDPQPAGDRQADAIRALLAEAANAVPAVVAARHGRYRSRSPGHELLHGQVQHRAGAVGNGVPVSGGLTGQGSHVVSA